MSRKLFAVLLSSALLSATIPTGAAGAQPATPSVSQTAAAKNQPPLPPGPARIKTAQGLEDDDLGPLAIVGGIAVATGLLVWLLFKSDEDDSSSSTGT